MKKLFFIASILFLGITTATAQSIKLGGKIGVNFSDLESVNATGGNKTGFHVGGLLELRVLDNLALQPELLYSTQGSELDGLGDQIKNELGYISLPVLAKFYLTKDKLSLELGPQASVLVSERNEVSQKIAIHLTLLLLEV